MFLHNFGGKNEIMTSLSDNLIFLGFIRHIYKYLYIVYIYIHLDLLIPFLLHGKNKPTKKTSPTSRLCVKVKCVWLKLPRPEATHPP